MMDLGRLFSQSKSRSYQGKFNDLSLEILTAFVSEILKAETIDIGRVGRKEGFAPILSLAPFADTQMNLILELNGDYVLQYQYETMGGNIKFLKHVLGKEEIEAIPTRIRELMQEGLESENVIQFNPRQLVN